MQPIRIRRRHLPFGLSTDWYDNKYTKQRSRSTVIVFFPLGPRERRQHRYRHLIPYPSTMPALWRAGMRNQRR